MGKWSLLALQGWPDRSPSGWARRQMRAYGHHSSQTHQSCIPEGLGTLDTCLCSPKPFPFQGRIWPPEILYTNKIVTNLHRRWGMSGSSCHGDQLPGPAVSASPEQFRHQEIPLCTVQLGPGLLPYRHAALLGTELALGWGWGAAPGPPIMLPPWTLLSSLTPGGPSPPAQALMVTCEDSFQGQGTAAAEPRATPEAGPPGSQGSEAGGVDQARGQPESPSQELPHFNPKAAPYRRQGQSPLCPEESPRLC